MHGGAISFLHMQEFLDQLFALFRHADQDAHHVLGAISEADAPGAQAQLIEGEVSGPVLGGVALPGVMDVEQAVHVGVRGLDLQPGQVGVPKSGHFLECPLHLLCVPIAVDQGKSFLNAFILAQLCDQPGGLAGLNGP